MPVFNQTTIEESLQTKWLGRRLFFYESLDSTNVKAHLLAAEEGLHGTLIVADRQTSGKGRRGRVWESPSGMNIYFSVLLRPDITPDKASMLTLLMAYAVKEAAEKESKALHCGIKWPNDVVMNGKKVCGILTEMYLDKAAISHVIIGVGINVKKQEFAPELAQKASSLEAECGRVISRSRLLADILQIFEREYENFAGQESDQNLHYFKDKYNSCLVNKDREVCVLDPKGTYCGVARGINDTGELLVELADGSMTEVYAGEVSVRGIYGYT